MRLCLVRHGETAWALSGQHTGVTDLALTAHGENQARALAARLQTLACSQVLVSPRLRAQQTCDLAGLGPASRVEPDLAEWDYGDYEGLRTASVSLLGIDARHQNRRIIELWNECQTASLSPAAA